MTPGGRDFLQAYNCPVVDSAHQVIVAAQATNQTSDKQPVAMVEEAIDNVAQRGIRRRRLLCTGGRRSVRAVRGPVRRAGADWCRQRPEVAYPAICLPGTGCAAADQGPATLRSADANGGAGVRPDQAGPRIPPVPATGPGEGQRRVVADLHRPQPAQTVQIWGGQPRETPTNRFAASDRNIVRVVGTVRRRSRQWLHPATIAVAV